MTSLTGVPCSAWWSANAICSSVYLDFLTTKSSYFWIIHFAGKLTLCLDLNHGRTSISPFSRHPIRFVFFIHSLPCCVFVVDQKAMSFVPAVSGVHESMSSRLQLIFPKPLAGEDVEHLSTVRFLAEPFEEMKRLSGCSFGRRPFIMVERNEVQRPAFRQEFERNPSVSLQIDAGHKEDFGQAVALRRMTL